MIADARRRLVDLARSLDGVGARSGRDFYLDMIASGETQIRSAGMARMSGCALVVRGLWRTAGVRHRVLERPYRTGMAVADLMTIAHEAGAIRPPEMRPAPADVVLVGAPDREHVYTVLRVLAEGWPTPGATWLEALDGGQRDERRAQACRVIEHEIGGAPPHDAGRPVRCVVDFGTVWARFGLSPAVESQAPPG